MRVKLDQNLPCDALSGIGPSIDVSTVDDEGLTGCDDNELWSAAQEEGRLLITQDMDFSDLRKYLPGTHAGLVLVRLQNPSRSRLVHRVRSIVASEEFLGWGSCLVVATESKVRVRRPKK